MKSAQTNIQKRERRHKRIRAKVFGTAEKPRLAVFKSNKHISAQLIDDQKAITLAAAHSREVTGKTLLEKSREVGKAVAAKAATKKISSVVFDRGGFIYTGAVRAVADGAREGGLRF